MYFVLVAGATLLLGDRSIHGWIIFSLTAIWGIRLSVYLTWRNWGAGEDYRYQRMRRYWGARFPVVSLFTVFLLQGAFAWAISLPLQVGIVAAIESAPGTLAYGGGIVWLAGWLFESVGDWQLARFKRDPANAGKVMSRGLWRYTRHPNYFGDALVWWGLFLVVVDASGAWWTVLGPVMMTWLLVRISGVPMLEKKLKKTRPGYDEYVARTSAFVPWPPRRDTASKS